MKVELSKRFWSIGQVASNCGATVAAVADAAAELGLDADLALNGCAYFAEPKALVLYAHLGRRPAPEKPRRRKPRREEIEAVAADAGSEAHRAAIGRALAVVQNRGADEIVDTIRKLQDATPGEDDGGPVRVELSRDDALTLIHFVWVAWFTLAETFINLNLPVTTEE